MQTGADNLVLVSGSQLQALGQAIPVEYVLFYQRPTKRLGGERRVTAGDTGIEMD
jgi:hypothetical protein